MPPEEIEEVLGKSSMVRPRAEVKLGETLQAFRPPPIELLPLLMILTLLVLTFEGVMANRFYRREQPAVSVSALVGWVSLHSTP